MKISSLEIRKARPDEAKDVHEILRDAFEPYKKDYPDAALKATVMSPQRIEQRMHEDNTEVWVALSESRIMATVALSIGNPRKLSLRSMAVHRDFQGNGIGGMLLENIERFAKENNCSAITLESYEPLRQAIRLYENFGFKRTGREREYFGIRIFEMVKDMGQAAKRSTLRRRPHDSDLCPDDAPDDGNDKGGQP